MRFGEAAGKEGGLRWVRGRWGLVKWSINDGIIADEMEALLQNTGTQ